MSYELPYENSHRGGSGRRDGFGESRSRPREYGREYGSNARTLYADDNRSKRPREFADYSAGRNDRDHYNSRRSKYDDFQAPGVRGYGDKRENYRGAPLRPRRPGADSVPPKPSRVLGVFGLSGQTEERDLYDVMSEFGQVEDIQMVFDSLTGRSRGFAFVYFASEEQATEARTTLSEGLELHGRIVRVDYSRTEAPHQPTPGIYMGKDKRRTNFGDRRVPRRFPRSPGGMRRSRSRTPLSPPRRSAIDPASRRRVRTQSSSRSRSPPPIFDNKMKMKRPMMGENV